MLAYLSVAVVLVASGCSDVKCPDGRVTRDVACVCPAPTVDVDGTCRAPDGPAPTGESSGPGDERSPGGPDDGGRNASLPPDDAAEDPNAPPPPPAPGGGRDAAVTPPGVVPGTLTPPAVPPSGTPTSTPMSPPEPLAPPLRPQCGNGVTEPPEQCDDGNDYPNDDCVRCTLPRCGDDFVQRSNREDCEIGPALGGPSSTGGWDANTCSASTCTRKRYTECEYNDQCSARESCLRGVCAPATCDVFSIEEQLQQQPIPCADACPRLPTHRGYLVDEGFFCVLRCFPPGGAEACPVGLVCIRDAYDVVAPRGQEPFVCASAAYARLVGQ